MVEEEKHGYEFGGPIGAFLISFGLPIGCYAFTFLCNDVSGCPIPSLLHPSTLTLDKIIAETGWPGFSGLVTPAAFIATVGYYALSLALYVLLPAQEVDGSVLKTGARLKYRFNAFSSAMFIMTILAAGTLTQGAQFPVWTFINDNYLGLLTSNIIIAGALASYTYLDSFRVKQNDSSGRLLADGGVTGNLVYDWYIGRELNPRVTLPGCGEIDIKTFMELRPGMLGWVILDLAFIAAQYRTYGKITDSILLTTFTQAVYTFDALYMESAILTTIDITNDGFGFMLSFGDLVWVPFVYSLQARYLAVHPIELGIYGVAAIVTVQLLGYYIFRSSNNEKNVFRTNPENPAVQHLTYIQTKTGSRLITSGWWGTARHINYLGDWLMSWAYCLPTLLSGYVVHTSILTGQKVASQGPNGEMRGWAIPITYFYMIYFAILLIHRAGRDEEKCSRKYGKDWETYCKKVPYRIIPYVY